MDKDFEDFIALRCGRALQECEEYLQNEYNGKLTPDQMKAQSEELCYKKGFMDAVTILMGCYKQS